MVAIPAYGLLMRATLFQTLDAIECQNVMYVQNKQDLPTDDDYRSFPPNFISNFNLVLAPIWQAAQSAVVHWVKLHAVVVDPLFGPEADAVYPVGTGGTLPDFPEPAFCAAVISKRTGLSGRINRGRYYIVGLQQTDVFQETIQDTEFTRLQALAAGFQNTYGKNGTSSQYEIVLYSHKVGDIAGHPTLAGARPLTQHLVRRTVYTQRHRLVGHGT